MTTPDPSSTPLGTATRPPSPSVDAAQNVIDGTPIAGAGAPIDVRFPVTGERFGEFRGADASQVDQAVAAARRTFDDGGWSGRPAEARAALLEAAADRLVARKDELVTRILYDNGKTRAEAEIDVLAAVGSCRRAAGHARDDAPLVRPAARGVERHVVKEPVGVVAGITPFNAPLMFAGLKAAPALAAGNTVVLKPSERSPLLTRAFADALLDVGLPDGALNVVHGESDVGAALCAHPGVDMITITGGTAAGGAVMRAASSSIKNVLLELGGKSAHIVLADADLEAAIPAVAAGIFRNAGQRCFSGSRLVVEASVADKVIEGVVAIAEGMRLGDPFDAGTQVGPLIDARAVADAEAFVERARTDGLAVACGGRAPAGLAPGSFFAPTVLVGARSDSHAAREEVFGPVLTVIQVADVDEAVRVANDTRYGLAGGVWSRDEAKAMAVARAVRAGYLWINTYAAIFDDVPFGGFGASGLGREAGLWGYDAYTELKSILIDRTGGRSSPRFDRPA